MEVPYGMGRRQYLRLLMLGGGLATWSIAGCGDSGGTTENTMSPEAKKALDEKRLGPPRKKYDKPTSGVPGKKVR